MSAGSAGRLLLGAGVTTCIFRMPEWLRSFSSTHPAVEVIVRTGGSREVTTMVLDREIDLGLVTSQVEHDDLDVTPLHEEKIILVARPDHPLAQGRVRSSDLDDSPLILFPQGSGFRGYLDRVLAEAGISARVKMETDSVEAIKSFVTVGLGVSFLPASAVAAEMARGALKRVRVRNLPDLRRRTSVVRRTDRYLSTAARDFLDLLCSG